MRYHGSQRAKILPIEPGCRKGTYQSLEEAQAMIAHINETRVTCTIHPYKCDICGFWHLTSKRKEL